MGFRWSEVQIFSPRPFDIFTLSLTFDEPGRLSRVSSFWGVGPNCWAKRQSSRGWAYGTV